MGWTPPRTGIVTAADLRALGWTERQRRRAILSGRLTALRRGVYALAEAPAPVVQIIRSGGCVTCVTALRMYGVWTPEARTVHQRHRDLRSRDCRPYGRHRPGPVIDPLPVCLLAAARCLPAEEFVAVLDSVLYKRMMSRIELESLLAGTPQRVRRLFDRVDRAESGTESLVRQRLRSRNIGVRPQVDIPGVGRVDFLIGDRLVVEVDSVAHHTDLENYFKDRERDRTLVAMGYLVVRLTYHDVIHRWTVAEETILRLVRSRRHLRRGAR